jgi:hypothetical protein
MQNCFQNPLTLAWNAPYCSSRTHTHGLSLRMLLYVAVGLFGLPRLYLQLTGDRENLYIVQRAERLSFDSLVGQRFSLQHHMQTACRADPSLIQLVPGLFDPGVKFHLLSIMCRI